jgi:nucleolar protein 16
MAHPRGRKKVKNPKMKMTRKLANKHHKKMPHITDHAIKKAWNKQLTMRQNFARLGLALDVNTDISALNQPLAGEMIIERTAEGHVTMKESMKEEPPARVSISNSPNEILKELEREACPVSKKKKYLCMAKMKLKKGLIATYGNDFEKMARDRHLNPYQHTAAQLKRLIGSSPTTRRKIC